MYFSFLSNKCDAILEGFGRRSKKNEVTKSIQGVGQVQTKVTIEEYSVIYHKA